MIEKVIENPYGFVYITTNLINGKKYIGRCKMQTTRKNSWKNYIGSGKAFEEAVKKYGKENFSRNIVSFAYSEKELNDQEIKLINFFDATNSDDFYNISNGQYFSYFDYCSTEEREQVIDKMKKNNVWNNLSEDELIQRKKEYSEKAKGEKNSFYNHHHTEETKEKISRANKGRKNEKFKYWKGKTGENSCRYNKKHTAESKQKMSISAKERIKRCGFPTSSPIKIFIGEKIYNFITLKSSYEFLCEKNLLLIDYKRSIPTNMCFDTYRKRIKNKKTFSSFTYEQ